MRPRQWAGLGLHSNPRVLRSLAALALTDPEGFASRLERHSARRIHVVAASLPPDAPSGVCMRTADADHLYYEAQTSPFHQAHILVGMTTHLLDEGPRAQIDPRLAQSASPRLAELVLGSNRHRPLTQRRAEALTFRAMGRAGATACPRPTARWFLRQLRPLHEALLDVVPEATARRAGGRIAPRLRLYRQVIEIRDAMLALRPYRDPRVVAVATTTARADGLRGDALKASVEATVLDAAVAAMQAGAPSPTQPGEVWQPYAAGTDLRSEADWLAKVSRAFARPLQLDQPPASLASGNSPHSGELTWGTWPARDFRSQSLLDGHFATRQGGNLRPREDWRSRP